jgi:hypothetical protein
MIYERGAYAPVNERKPYSRSAIAILIAAICVLIAFVFARIFFPSFIVQAALLLMLFILFLAALVIFLVRRGKKKVSIIVVSAVILVFATPILIMNGINIHHDISVKMLQSTDLSDVLVDTMYAGMNMREFDEEKYAESDRYDLNGYSKGYDAFRLREQDGMLSKIDADMSYVSLSINHHSDVKTIEEVKSILGGQCFDAEYDREQLYNSCTYIDKDRKTKAEFVYDSISNDLQTVLLSMS